MELLPTQEQLLVQKNGFYLGSHSRRRTFKKRCSSTVTSMLEGMFEKENFLDIIRHFITYNKTKSRTDKILAGYHQFPATNKAVKTQQAIKTDGRSWLFGTPKDCKISYNGFLYFKNCSQPELDKPTIVVLR
jgi:type I restriction enzyme R subunit